MTDSTEVNGRAKVCDRREHRATPGREAGVVRTIAQKKSETSGFGQFSFGLLSATNSLLANRDLTHRHSDNRYAPN